MMNDSIYISSDDKNPPTKKAKEEDEIRNDYIWKSPGDGYCVIHCFGKQLHKSTEFVLQHLWYKISKTSHIYMEFGTYSSLDKLRRSYQNIFLKTHINLTQQILSMKPFLEFTVSRAHSPRQT